MNCGYVLRILQAVPRGVQQNSRGSVSINTIRVAAGCWSPFEFARSVGDPHPTLDYRRVRLLLTSST